MPAWLQLHKHRTRLTAWLGLMALCAQLLAGGVSNWQLIQRLAGAPSLFEVCSSTGLRSGQDPADQHTSAAQHCAFCLASGDAPLLPAVSTRIAVLASPASRPPLRSVGIAPRAPDLRHARSRAPPFFA